MVPFVEDVAGGQRRLLAAAQRRLHHDQRVVGDHHVGLAGAAHALLDVAAGVMVAGGVDALAPPVGEAQRPPAPGDVDQPAGEIAAGQVAVARRRRPARHQPDPDGVVRLHRHATDGLLQVQQAQVVFPALAQHDLARLGRRLGVEAVQLRVDLVLEVAGVSGDPHRPAVLLRPHRGRRQIAQRFADARSGFRQHDVRRVGGGARGEGGGHRAGVVGLLRARLGDLAGHTGRQHHRQPAARLVRLHRVVGGRRLGRAVLPLLDAGPDAQAGAAGALLRPVRLAERGQHGGRPQPAGAPHLPGEGHRVGRLLPPRRTQQAKQLAHRPVQGQRVVLQPVGNRQVQRLGQPARGRHAEAGGQDEGEQLQQVEGGEGLRPQPPRHGPRVADERRLAARPLHGGGGRQFLHLPITGQQNHAARTGHQCRRVIEAEGREGGRRGQIHGAQYNGPRRRNASKPVLTDRPAPSKVLPPSLSVAEERSSACGFRSGVC